MKIEPSTTANDPQDEIEVLLKKLSQTHQRLQELTAGQVDFGLPLGSQAFVLQEAREKLRESEERFRGLFAAAATGIAVAAPNGSYLQANAAYCRMLGYTEEELRALNFASLTHPDDLNLDLQLRDELLAGQRESFFMEKRYLKKNGDILWARQSVSATYAPGGNVTTLMVIAEDITQRKLAEDALRHSEERLRLITNLVPHGIFAKDATGRHLFANPALAELAGLSIEEILGKNDFELVADKAQAEAYRADDLAVIRSGRKMVISEEPRTDLSGRTRFLQTIKIPFTLAETGEPAILGVCMDITERKRAEEALLRQQTELQVLFDLMPAMLCFKDTKNVFLRVNQRLAEAAGKPIAEIEGKSAAEIFPLDAEKYYADDLDVIRAGTARLGIIEKFRNLHGKDLWVQTDKVPVSDKDGKVTGIVVMVQDITQRKLNEEALRYSEGNMAAAQRIAHFGSWELELTNLENVIANPVRWSDEIFRIAGYEPGAFEASNLMFFKHVPVEEHAAIHEAMATAIRERGHYSVVHRLIRPNGEERLIHEVAQIFYDEKTGRPLKIIGTTHDITELKRAEESRLQSLALLRATLESTADGILTIGSDRQILSYNETFVKMSRIPADILAAKDDVLAIQCIIDQLKTPEQFLSKVRHLYDHPLEESFDVLDFKDDRVFERYSRPMLVEGRPTGRVWSFRDVTERKKLEQQFLRAQRMESIGTLAGGVAHDLNNILAPIMMSIELLKAVSANPQARAILETIEVSAKRGADIVRQVLSFARGLEGQRIEVQPKHLLKDLENIIKDTFPKDIQLQFSIASNIWTILGDPTQVHQILLNLCVNARDAMANGGELNIGVENAVLDEHYAAMNMQAKPGRYVKISVTDSGLGIPQEIINKIFEPFFTTKELTKGTGLGLSTVLAIVKSHEGIVNVYSEPNKGTTFKVYLPAADAASEAPKQPREQPSMPRGNGEIVLVIDDEASIRTITSQTLQAFGYRVLTARDGAEAVAIYVERKSEIAVVLTDMMMPVMDGLNVIRVLTRINPTVKIVAASGLAANGSGNRLPEAGVKHFLMKPYTAETLLKTMRATLEGA